MDALVNGLLWLGMFAIPMLIAVVLRRLDASTAWTTATVPETQPRSPTTEGGRERAVHAAPSSARR